ncbi:ribosome maturation factor RimP [Oscillatoria sp. CS-180]|uniref:ribosome maturation factor RimP n=1 Tax=Oscillatoria sp. CS-180 TaxID=3021720 RepID=UPI00232FB2E9|nr:ribosome maturation factor RimP [Oscillatoria sp. CS-180]MDB9529854.1 ribosome maturation factor RimP [Oscillatoria sp. CS-180]
MVHPLIPKVLDLAAPVAEHLGLDVVDAVFQTNHSPPILRIDVRNSQAEDTSLQDCEQMSQALETILDETNLIPDAYVLEVSSPGISSELTSERDFLVFKGFMVEIQLAEAYKNRQTWLGQLLKRDDDYVYLSQKGKPTKLPRELVQTVQLSDRAPE